MYLVQLYDFPPPPTLLVNCLSVLTISLSWSGSSSHGKGMGVGVGGGVNFQYLSMEKWRYILVHTARVKKKIKFSSYIRKFRGIECKVIYCMTNGLLINILKYLRISSYIRKPFLIYDFAPDPDPIWISLNMRIFFINEYIPHRTSL
jgi:hypothetical protein